jgi:peptide/nickel transport system substrate-binding protein
VTEDSAVRDGFLNLPFWTSDYIGAGPYRLDRWEPGTGVQAIAFEGHVLGRPRIERVVIRLVADENIMLTNLLAGEIDIATRFTPRFEHAEVPP